MSCNPAANGICEYMYQTVELVLHTLLLIKKSCTLVHAKKNINQALDIASHAVRINVNQTICYNPGEIVFHQDMLINVPLVVNLLAGRDKRQLQVDIC